MISKQYISESKYERDMTNRTPIQTVFVFVILLMTSRVVSAKQWLIFYAEAPSNSSASGHTFITFIKENTQRSQTEIIGCWGFYPKEGMSLKAVWGEVEGEIREDLTRQKDKGFLIEVSENEFNIALAKKNVWAAKSYNLRSSSCVDFVKDLIAELAGLKKPNLLYKVPIDYVKNLRVLNKSAMLMSEKSFITNPIETGRSSADKGINLLFKGINTKLTQAEKNALYTLLKFDVAKDKKQFTIDYDQEKEYPFEAYVYPTDLNKDGLEEIFITYGNFYTSGMTSQQVTLFIKNAQGDYQRIFDQAGLLPDILKQHPGSYPDLVISGRGFSFPIQKWTGSTYKPIGSISDSALSKAKLIDIEAASKAYQLFIKR